MAQNHDQSQTSQEVMNMAANRATRFVYLRTLPLVKQPELGAHVKPIVDQIEDGTRRLCEKHLSTATDERAAVHLHTTALAIATHRVLSAWIKNEIRLSNIIRSGFGAETLSESSPSEKHKQQVETSAKKRPDFWIVRAALWFSLDRMAAVRRMTENMVKDFGATFETSQEDDVIEGQQHHSLFVSKFPHLPPFRREQNCI
ncbi:hypothetical protein FGB62_19g033 [Gracilaria domingensis]|nr:hypothetical protein FGB62_19g033 [Gracilaria domingensis]